MHQDASNSESADVHLRMDIAARPTRLISGEGVVQRIGALAKELGGTHALIVTDPGIVAAGHLRWLRMP